MKKLFLRFCFILLTANIFLVAEDITVMISDKDIDIPVEGVKIFILERQNSIFTDKDGKAIIKNERNFEKLTLICSFPGYETKKITLKPDDKEITVKMSMENILSGKELVIEEKYYESKEEVGKSLVVDKEELKTLAMRGTIEDVISSIKTMPGISYSAGFMTDLSIRGSNSSEVVASYDGFIVRDPFYWGSGYSIFNPNIVKSVKLNNGYFPVKFGNAMSGLLDVNIKSPDEGFKIDSKIALSTSEVHIETPLGIKDMGFLLGSRATYLDLTMGNIWKATGTIVPRVPYIYDGNLKWVYKPNKKLEFYINGFVGADGSGFGDKYEESKGIDSENIFLNDKIHAIGFTGIKAMPADKIRINWLGGYEYRYENYKNELIEEGTIHGIDVDLKTGGENLQTMHSFQTRIDIDIELQKRILMGIGGDFIYDFENSKYKFDYFDTNYGKKISDERNFSDTNDFSSGAYLNFNFYPVPELLEIELGLRIGHYCLSAKNNFLNTDSVFDPRLSISITPAKNLSWLESFVISLSTGLYSQMPSMSYDNDNPIKSFSILQEKVFTNVIGFDFNFPYAINLKIESYFKYYFNRHYANEIIDNDNNKEYKHHSDGYGHAAGFDIMLKRKISKYIDGWVSYSFIYTRLFYPEDDGLLIDEDKNGNPTGEWFYPSYHRWHSMNIVLNIKPTNWLTISPSFGVHSGIPLKVYKDKISYTGVIDSKNITLYKRDVESYDQLRTLPSLPLSIKITFHWYFPRKKIGMEFYGSFDNILSFFYNPDSTGVVNRIDKYTGDYIYKSKEAYETYQYGFGIRLSY